ncbi:MAG: hypothetical protein NUW37_01580 [Planctomycetes bacterium]|nr:hypothetical protein [Planctomycetota bacterium]
MPKFYLLFAIALTSSSCCNLLYAFEANPEPVPESIDAALDDGSFALPSGGEILTIESYAARKYPAPIIQGDEFEVVLLFWRYSDQKYARFPIKVKPGAGVRDLLREYVSSTRLRDMKCVLIDRVVAGISDDEANQNDVLIAVETSEIVDGLSKVDLKLHPLDIIYTSPSHLSFVASEYADGTAGVSPSAKK